MILDNGKVFKGRALKNPSMASHGDLIYQGHPGGEECLSVLRSVKRCLKMAIGIGRTMSYRRFLQK